MGTTTFKLLINRITKTKKILIIGHFKKLLEDEISTKKKVNKCMSMSTIV
jgi:hypothetical protein